MFPTVRLVVPHGTLFGETDAMAEVGRTRCTVDGDDAGEKLVPLDCTLVITVTPPTVEGLGIDVGGETPPSKLLSRGTALETASRTTFGGASDHTNGGA